MRWWLYPLEPHLLDRGVHVTSGVSVTGCAHGFSSTRAAWPCYVQGCDRPYILIVWWSSGGERDNACLSCVGCLCLIACDVFLQQLQSDSCFFVDSLCSQAHMYLYECGPHTAGCMLVVGHIGSMHNRQIVVEPDEVAKAATRGGTFASIAHALSVLPPGVAISVQCLAQELPLAGCGVCKHLCSGGLCDQLQPILCAVMGFDTTEASLHPSCIGLLWCLATLSLPFKLVGI